MGHLYLVRHGQASLGADDYDQLSPLGVHQAQRLGEHWQAQGLKFDAVLTGTLKRHRQTFEGIQRGLGETPSATLWPGLNEYDSEAVIRCVHPGPLSKPTTPDGYREHFRLLRQGLKAWMTGQASPQGMPGHAEFLQGITCALDHIRHQHNGNVLLVSSGGPISMAVGHVLNLEADSIIELNLRIRNSAVCEFSFNPKRHSLVSFNTIPHLETPNHKDWITYA
jgi:broad specificity phosphatase PhoE